MKTSRYSAYTLRELTEGQIECLRLVNRHLTSKEIGRLLGISPHTVDQRIRRAMKTLGVDRRVVAARVVSREVSRNLFRWPDGHQEAFVVQRPRAMPLPHPRALPFATDERPSNTLTLGQRLLWIVLIGFGAAFSVGIYLAGLESLVRLLRS